MDNIIDASRVFVMDTSGDVNESMGRPECLIGNIYTDSILNGEFQEEYSKGYSNIVGILDYLDDNISPIELFNDSQIIIGCLKQL